MIKRLQILLTNTILTLLEKVAVGTLFDIGSLKDGKIIVEKIIESDGNYPVIVEIKKYFPPTCKFLIFDDSKSQLFCWS